jgi:hypothetical protein
MTTGWVWVTVIALTLIKATTSYANEVYVNQVGDNLELTVVQDGWDNEFRYCATATADSNCIDLEGNATVPSRGNSSDNSVVDVSMTGDENIVRTSHAAGQNNGNTRETIVEITGDENSVMSRLTNNSSGGSWGGHKESETYITGDGNTVKHSSDSYGVAYGGIYVTGDDNDVILYQRSLNNSATITVTNAGGPVTANIQQLGSSYQDSTAYSISITEYCTNANGCAVNVTQN